MTYESCEVYPIFTRQVNLTLTLLRLALTDGVIGK